MNPLLIGFNISALGDVCNLIGGGTPSKKNDDFYKGYIPWATVRDMRKDVITQTEFKITEDAVKKSSTNIIKAGNVVIATRVGLGKVCIVNQDTAINQDLRGIVPKSSAVLSVRYLFWWLKSIAHFIEEEGTGATVKGVKLPFVKSLQIPLPSLPEQKRIVAILDEAFAGISQAVANAEKNIANARELFESYLNNIFTQKGEGCRKFKVEEVCQSIVDCINKTAPKVERPTLFQMIRTTNIRYGRVNLDVVKYVSEETYHAWTRRQVPRHGDVLLTREAPLGEVGMLLTDDLVFLGQRIVSYRADPKVLNNKFLLYAFQSSDIQRQIKKLASGSTVQHMRVPDTKNLEISVPSLLEQTQIVSQLVMLKEKVQRLESIYKQKITALAELKQSILQKAFTGQLTMEKG